MVGVRLNAFTGKILWYTLDFFPLSRQPQCGILGKRVGKRVPGRTMMRNPVGAAPVLASCHPSGMAGRTGVQPRLGVVRETVPQGVLQIYPTIFSIGILLSPRPDNSQGDLVFPGAGAPGSYFIAPAAAAKPLPSSTFPAPIRSE